MRDIKNHILTFFVYNELKQPAIREIRKPILQI